MTMELHRMYDLHLAFDMDAKELAHKYAKTKADEYAKETADVHANQRALESAIESLDEYGHYPVIEELDDYEGGCFTPAHTFARIYADRYAEKYAEVYAEMYPRLFYWKYSETLKIKYSKKS
jgi:hypothetical protein